MGSTGTVYEFVVVGGGPAGCALASRLAGSEKRPNVLLLEAGCRNDDPSLRVEGQRWTTFTTPGMNWGYKTTPQEHCNGRQIDYARGKALGGSSSINFGVYTYGARDDYDEWAAAVGDDTFRWDRIQSRLKSLETFDGAIAGKHNKYAAPKEADHGLDGGLRVGYSTEWEQDLPLMMDIFEQAGFARNSDHNSGDPIGMSLVINSSSKGKRTTAADLLKGAPDNLTVITEAPVQRLVLDGKKVIGAESRGNRYLASKEVILTAGSLDTPKILMHSGIGPADQLQQFNIPVTHEMSAMGKGLRDHYFAPMCFRRDPETNDRNTFFGDEAAKEAAMEQWKKDGSGPWARYACQLGVGFFKSDNLTASSEFQDLDPSVKEYLQKPTVPHYEFMTHFPIHMFSPELIQGDYSYMCMLVFLMNQQSRGEVRLQSSDPDIPLLFDPKFLAHPFDRRACIETYREAFQVTKHEAFKKHTVSTLIAPASESDEDILELWKNTTSSSWHMTGTCKMGPEGSSDAVVNSKFQVIGLENLRIADMSVVPVLVNGHVQATAYVTGATCAETLTEEYGLNA